MYCRNIFKWGLVLKISSKEIQLCNRNLYLMDDLRTTTFFSFKIACMCHRPAVVEGQFKLSYNSANVRPSVINSLPYIFASFFYLQLHTMNTVSHGILLPQKVNKLKSCLNAKTLHSKWL